MERENLPFLTSFGDWVFAAVGYNVDGIFNAESRTRWQSQPRQAFEMEVQGNGGTYQYTLWVDTEESQRQPRVVIESLDFNREPVILFNGDQVSLFDKRKTSASNEWLAVARRSRSS